MLCALCFVLCAWWFFPQRRRGIDNKAQSTKYQALSPNRQFNHKFRTVRRVVFSVDPSAMLADDALHDR